jgi:hypothetical protein
VYLAWAALLLNTLTFFPSTWSGEPLIVPIPSAVGKLIQQGALYLAFLLALTVNRRLAIRPNVFLCLTSLLAVEAFITAGEATHVGTVYRAVRLAAFIATLWLLSPWWGRRDMPLVRAHLGAVYVILGSVLLGAVISPSRARAEGRLAGALWPTPPTQVAEFAAVTIGIVVVLWLGGEFSGRLAMIVVAVAGAILLLTHTRTALASLVGALFVAGLSLFLVRARVRKIFAAAGVIASIGAITLSSLVTTWLIRGQDAAELTHLSGRTTVWSGVVGAPRDTYQMLFGFGLSNKSFNGLSIDSNWLASYLDQGIAGIVISAAIIIFLLVSAFFQPRGVHRALALFLATYCLAASFTEVGFSDASTYLLYLTLAASLLVPVPLTCHSTSAVGRARPGCARPVWAGQPCAVGSGRAAPAARPFYNGHPFRRIRRHSIHGKRSRATKVW